MNKLSGGSATQRSRSDAAVTAWMLILLSPLAISAIVVRIAVYGSLSFEVAAYGFVVISVLVLALLAAVLKSRLWDLLRLCADADISTLCIVAASCVMASVATTCLHRSDLDDAIYLPKIVHYVTFPKSVMNGEVYEIASAKALAFPRAAAPYYPTSYEFAEAAFAYTARVDFLYVYYAVAPFIAGVLGVLGLILCLRFLGVSVNQAACSVLVIVPLTLLLGETHRSLGNVTLMRVFQSKFAFFVFGLPFFVGASIAYFRNKSWYTWTCLGTLALAFGGMTTSALVMLPLLALLLAGAWWLVHIKRRLHLGYLLVYGASLFPVIVFAIDYRRYAAAWVKYGAPANSWFPASFWGQFDLVYTSGVAPISLVLLAATLSICLYKAKENAFILTWFALAVLALLNPVTAPWIMQHLTTENIYWRLFYLLPAPLLGGVAYAQLTDRLTSLKQRQWLACSLSMVLIGLLFVIPTSTLRSANGTTIGWPGYTMDAMATSAKDVLALSPDGEMLAPVALAQDMAILSAAHEQIATRADFLENVLQNQHAEYQLRMSAAQYVAGQGGSAADVITILRRNKLSTVVLNKGALDLSLFKELKAQNFRVAGQVNDWLVYVRS